MENEYFNIRPFEKNISSAFVVCSPFQALCAIAAIRQLEIDDYKVIVILPKEELHNEHVGRLLNKYNINYINIPPYLIKGWFFKSLRWLSLIPRITGYHRLFIGDYRNMMELVIGCNLICDNSDVVLLDDGNPTLNLLNENASEPLKYQWEKWKKRIEKYRGIYYLNNLLTIYGDISNKKFNIRQLDLNKVIVINNNNGHQKDVYVVGTNIEGFCGSLEIPEKVFINKLEKLLIELRLQYPEDRIIYVSHRRENKMYAEDLCKKHDCLFCRPKMMIEIEALNFSYQPKAIFGFTSNALFTLKKIFPTTMVVNILIESPTNNLYYRGYEEISKYYLKNGIKLIKER